MKGIGIVAEYNPFHNGHAYQIAYAKEQLHAACVVVAMSGYFTQRGTPSVLDPYIRANTALQNGADLVIQIPTVFSCASAREYAAAGILTLANSSIVDTVLFGAENADRRLFDAAARASVRIDGTSSSQKTREASLNISIPKAADSTIEKMISDQLTQGVGFAKARSIILEKLIKEQLPEISDEEISDFVSSPNNILGIQYVQAIIEHDLPLSYEIIPRKGKGYHNTEVSKGVFASASGIRHKIYPALHGRDMSESLKSAMPQSAYTLLDQAIRKDQIVIYDDLSLPVWMKAEDAIRSGSLTSYTDCSEDLANKIQNTFSEYTTVKAYCKFTLRSKDLAFTRINRVMAHILLGITNEITDSAKEKGYVPYLLVLGVSKTSKELLSELTDKAKCPVIIRPAEAKNILNDETAKTMYSIDEEADRIYNAVLSAKTNTRQKNMYQRKFLITD